MLLWNFFENKPAKIKKNKKWKESVEICSKDDKFSMA
jgi:hypothetical protein